MLGCWTTPSQPPNNNEWEVAHKLDQKFEKIIEPPLLSRLRQCLRDSSNLIPQIHITFKLFKPLAIFYGSVWHGGLTDNNPGSDIMLLK